MFGLYIIDLYSEKEMLCRPSITIHALLKITTLGSYELNQKESLIGWAVSSFQGLQKHS